MLNDGELQIVVIGAGHGGKSMAADLASRGYAVRLYNRSYAHIEAIALRGGIEVTLEDGRQEFGPLRLVTSDLAAALDGAHLVMVVVPASAHRDIALACAPHLQDGQCVVLNPGRTGGALEFRQVLRETYCTADVVVAEAETLLFACRSDGPAEAHVFRRKNTLPLAALPSTRTHEVLDMLQEVYPQFIAAPNVLYTSLNNMGAVFHPALTLLNAGWIEASIGDFEFYIDGVTPSTAHVLERLDRERVTVATAMGIRAQSAQEWLARAYSAYGDNLYESIHANPGYRGITAPRTLRHRYIFEDVPYSLVPISELGRRFGVDVVAMEAMIQLACVLHGTDYRHRGRTLARMGLDGLSVTEITRLVETGVADMPADAPDHHSLEQ
ncbi:MAG TPA: NAD/NADP octopine/nopaline dehydrogenase family protein [Aggregatilineaceae bacterium]|nr:NAD/NADP octopine/nopaline dehydrogenase family protein [Aggregatilineaceae bacterium]